MEFDRTDLGIRECKSMLRMHDRLDISQQDIDCGVSNSNAAAPLSILRYSSSFLDNKHEQCEKN